MEPIQQLQTQQQGKDNWEQALEQKLIKLRECQQEHTLKSCFDCSKLLKCTLRDAYVNAVYESMSKGHGGGFEF